MGCADSACEGLLKRLDGRPGGQPVAPQNSGDSGNVVFVNKLPTIRKEGLCGAIRHSAGSFSRRCNPFPSSQSLLVLLA